MKILKRSMEQEKAIEHLKKILYPEKQLLAEKEYQGFNKALNEKDMMKKREIEMISYNDVGSLGSFIIYNTLILYFIYEFKG